MYTYAGAATPITLSVEPLPFSQWPGSSFIKEEADPFFESVLEMLLTIDDGGDDEKKTVMINSTWPQVTAIKIPSENTVNLVTSSGIIMTPDDQRATLSSLAHAMSPGGVQASRKRLRIETLNLKDEDVEANDDDEDEKLQKRMLTNSRRDAVMTLREEARALEATLKGLHLRQSRPKPALSDDPEALVKSYAENIQLKRAIEEQDARIKTLRRAVSLREGKAATPGNLLIR